MGLLTQHATVLSPGIRHTLVQALILLRNRDVVDAMALLPLFFHLFQVQDKNLRELMYNHIVADMRKINLKGGNTKTNRSCQNYLYSMLDSDQNEVASKKALDAMIELYRKRIWVDERTVNMIGKGCASKNMRVAVRWGLGRITPPFHSQHRLEILP